MKACAAGILALLLDDTEFALPSTNALPTSEISSSIPAEMAPQPLLDDKFPCGRQRSMGADIGANRLECLDVEYEPVGGESQNTMVSTSTMLSVIDSYSFEEAFLRGGGNDDDDEDVSDANRGRLALHKTSQDQTASDVAEGDADDHLENLDSSLWWARFISPSFMMLLSDAAGLPTAVLGIDRRSLERTTARLIAVTRPNLPGG